MVERNAKKNNKIESSLIKTEDFLEKKIESVKTIQNNSKIFYNKSKDVWVVSGGKRDFEFVREDTAKIWAAEKGTLSWSDHKIKKLIACGLFAQTMPFMIRDQGSSVGVSCRICGHTVIKAASCTWKDKQRDGSFRDYTLFPVCGSCLDKSGVAYLHEEEWMFFIMELGNEAQYRSFHDAHDYACDVNHLCSGETTWIYLPYGKFMLRAAVCDRHFNAIVGQTVKLEQNKLVDKWQESDLISQETKDRLAAFAPLRNKGGKHGK